MSQATARTMTVGEFLAWEDRQERRWEFDGFRPVAMVGETVRHGRFKMNIGAALHARLRGSPCEAFVEGIRVQTEQTVRYPDIAVTCSPQEYGARELLEPVVLFEVLSASTAGTDTIAKNREYRELASLRRYVIVAQDYIGATAIARDGERWVSTVIEAGGTLDLTEIGVSIPLNEIYEGTDAAPPPDPRADEDDP